MWSRCGSCGPQWLRNLQGVMLHAKGKTATSSIYSSHTPTRKHNRLRAVTLHSARFRTIRCCFLSSVRQGSRALASSSSLCGADRSATYPCGGAAFVRAARHCHDVHETTSLNHIFIGLSIFLFGSGRSAEFGSVFVCVGVADHCFFVDHRRSHRHHFCVLSESRFA